MQSFRGGPLRAEEEVYRHHWVLFPYDLAEFVSPWQGFEGVKNFSRGDAERRMLEIGSMNSRDQAGDQDLIGGVTVSRHGSHSHFCVLVVPSLHASAAVELREGAFIKLFCEPIW
ncbi:MAG: hypothetical protein JWP89_873 [Schlesneria sp.]|nr:hypothetical protein [Schlesneria sp.]